MSCEKGEISAYMMNHRVSEQSPMRSNYLSYCKMKRSKSGHRVPKSPSDTETRHFEDKGHTRKRQSFNMNKLIPGKSGSDLCLEDIKKQRKRGLLATTLLSSTHEAWDLNHSSGAYGAPATCIDKFLEQKQMASLKKNKEHESMLMDTWNNHKNNCSLTKATGGDPENHKSSTHFERLFGDRSKVHEFAALNAALPPRKLFFMQEYPCKMINSEAKQATAETAGCNKRRSYIEKSRNLFGFSHKLPIRDKFIFPETCDVRYEIPVRTVERPHAAAIEHDHEMYASYIGDHCRKNRRGRNSNKNFNMLPQSKVDVGSELDLHGVRGDNPKRSLASFDYHTFSDLSSEYPISDLDDRPFGNSNFSRVPSQKELNFNSFLTEKKNVKKVVNTKENNAVIEKKHDYSGRCRSRDDIEEAWESSISMSDKGMHATKRRTKKKRQRSGTKKTPYCKQNMQEEENKNSVNKHYNEQRRHVSTDVDKRTVSCSFDNANEVEQKHRSDSKTRRKLALLNEPGVFIKDGDHFKPLWTCTKWAKENKNKNTQDSSDSHWAYEVYSETCLNPALNGLQRGIRNARGNEGDLQECDMPDDHLRETNPASLGYRQPVLCSANMTHFPSDKPHKLAECNLAYEGAPIVTVMPFLVANYNPMIAGQTESESSKLTRTVWSQISRSENCNSINTTDRKINTSHDVQLDHRMVAESKSNKGAEDAFNSKETGNPIDNCDLGKYKKKAYIKKSKYDACLNQPSYTKQRHRKLQSTSSVEEGVEVADSDISSKKSQCSVDEKLIRTVHSIKVDIESVFDRLNSLDASKDESVVQTALSLKDSVRNVIVQAKAAEHSSRATHVINAAEIIKNALKTLTTFKATFAASKTEGGDSHELSYELYKRGKETYAAEGSSEDNIQIVSIDSTRKPYVRVETDVGRSGIMPSTDNSLSETDAASFSTVCPKPNDTDSTENAPCVSTAQKTDGRRQNYSRLSNRTVNETNESVVESTILKKLAHSAEQLPFSSAEKSPFSPTKKSTFSSGESTFSCEPRETMFEQKFEEMLTRFPPEEREFQVTGIPESLTRERRRMSPMGKTKKKRKGSPYNKKRNSSTSKKSLHKDSSAADEKPSWKTTKRKLGKISAKKEEEKTNAALKTPSECQTAVMMQPQISTKEKPSEDTCMESLTSALAPCEMVDIAGAMEVAPELKKYREQMLQSTSELDDTLEVSGGPESILLKEPTKSWRGPSDIPKATRDIQIIYKISSKTTLTEDDKSFINAICLRQTEEEIMAVPYDSESTSPSIRRKGCSDPCSTDNSRDVGNASGDQLWSGRNNKKDEIEKSGDEIKGFRLPSEASKSASGNNLFGHDQQRQVEATKDLLSSGISRFASCISPENDVGNIEAGVSRKYHLAKHRKAKKSSEAQEMPNSLCNFSELTGNVMTALDSNKESSLGSFDELVSACKEMNESKHSKAFEMQTSESYDASISSGYMKTRETAELLLPESGTSVNCQREKCIEIQQNDPREKPTNKATQKEASEVLDNTIVSMLNDSIIKLYEEVSKLRVKLETTTENPTTDSSPKDDSRKSRSRKTTKKKKKSKESSSESGKSSSSTQSSRASSRGHKAVSDDDGRSSPRDHYFEVSPVYSTIQMKARGQMSGTDLRTSPASARRQLCCAFRKYDTKFPQTMSGYYDKKVKIIEQVPHDKSDSFYLEYEPENDSPAMYIEHISQDPSPASYMELDDDDSSVASYAKQAEEFKEASQAIQNVQYFPKNILPCADNENIPEKTDGGGENYWSGFSSVSPSKLEISETTKSVCGDRDGSGVISSGKFNQGDVTDNLFLREQSKSGIVHEYLSREKETFVEYTSNILTQEGVGLQLNDIADTISSMSAPLDCHLHNSHESSDLKDDLEKCKPQPLEPDTQVHDSVTYDSGLLTVDCHTNDDSETATEKTQHYLRDNESACDVILVTKEEQNTDLLNTSETIVNHGNEQRSNLPSSTTDHIVRLDENSEQNLNPPAVSWSSNVANNSNENLTNVSTENLHQSSNEETSEQKGEPVKTPTPPMWSDSEESLGKNEEDYIASLHIPRIVQCVRDMFFGSTKAQSKEANHKNPKPYDWRSGTSSSSKGKCSNDSEMTRPHSRCQTADSDTDDDALGGFSTSWRRQSHNESVKEDYVDTVNSPLQHNYISRKKESRVNTESQVSPSMESPKKRMSCEVEETNEESPHYSEYSWTGKDIGNYNFVGGNILLTSHPFIHCRSMGYLPAFKHVEETDKTIRHYCDAINSNTSKRLNSLDNRCVSIPTSGSGEGSSSARLCNNGSEDAEEPEGMMEYGKTPFLENCSVPGQNDWSSTQCADCFPKWQSQMTPSPMLARYQNGNILQHRENTMQQRRPCYVEHCGFRQKRCDSFENSVCSDEHDVNNEINHDADTSGVHKVKHLGANDNNSSHELTRKEDVQGHNSVKHSGTLRRASDMFYANESLTDSAPFECSKKLDSSASKHLFTSRDVSETNLYNSCVNIRSVDYEKGGQMKHYKQEPRFDQVAHAKEDAIKSKAAFDEGLEKSGKDAAEDDEERVSLSDDENTDVDAVSDDTSMEDDERESWYKTTDDESNS